MEATRGNAVTVSAITNANPGVVTATAHGYSDGDVVILSGISGMVELEGQACRIAGKTTDNFQLEGLNTTAFGTFSSTASVYKIATWTTISQVQSIESQQAQPAKIDVTTLSDTVKAYVFGLPDDAGITLNALYDPSLSSHIAIKAASDANATKVFKFQFGTPKMVGNFYVVGGDGFSMAANDVAKTNYSLTSVKRRMNYAS